MRSQPLAAIVPSICVPLLTMALLLPSVGCKKPAPPPAMGPVPVDVTTAEEKDIPAYGDWVATTDGYVNAQIQPQVSGYLLQQTYKEGSFVRKGQVLFEIDQRPFQASLDQAKGNLEQAKAQAVLAQINVDRDTPLVEARALARSTLDNETQQLAQSKASISTNEALVRQAQLNLEFTHVRSLISGIAGQATIQVGNLVSNSSILTSVSQVDPIKVYFSISEQEYLSLSGSVRSRGRDLLSAGDAVPLQLTLANGDVYPHKGHIVFVDRGVSAQTGSLRIAAAFANPGNLIRPGQFGRIKAQTAIHRSAILIPQRSTTELQGNSTVAVVGPDNKVSMRTVKLGAQVGPMVVVESGVKAGERVVTEGLGKLRDGAPVTPQAASADQKPSPSAQEK